MKKYNRITLNNFKDYVSGKHNNGGCYGFWEEYNRINGSEIWEKSYGTTSDFYYCPCCGSFNNHYDDEDGIYTCEFEFTTVTTNELKQIIKQFELEHLNDEKYFISTK